VILLNFLVGLSVGSVWWVKLAVTVRNYHRVFLVFVFASINIFKQFYILSDHMSVSALSG
jgi:hypothetical protein